jgi:hypothetical protein
LKFRIFIVISLLLAFSGASQAALMQWNVYTDPAPSDGWLYSGYVQADTNDFSYDSDIFASLSKISFTWSKGTETHSVFGDSTNFGYGGTPEFVISAAGVVTDARMCGDTDCSTLIHPQTLVTEHLAAFSTDGAAVTGLAVAWSGGVSVSVPEPSIIALFGLGLVGLGFARRRRQS